MLGQIEASVIFHPTRTWNQLHIFHNWEIRVHFKVSHAKKWLQDFKEDQLEYVSQRETSKIFLRTEHTLYDIVHTFQNNAEIIQGPILAKMSWKGMHLHEGIFVTSIVVTDGILNQRVEIALTCKIAPYILQHEHNYVCICRWN